VSGADEYERLGSQASELASRGPARSRTSGQLLRVCLCGAEKPHRRKVIEGVGGGLS
jgi:hypothetical protein